MRHVVSHFVRLRWYYVMVIPIDSRKLGEPVKRPRYYFVLVRRDVAVIKDRQQLADFVKAMLVKGHAPCSDAIVDRMLPNSHPSVRDYLAQLAGVSKSRSSDKAKWKEHCDSYALSHGVSRSVGTSPGGVRGLTLPRTQATWGLLTRVHKSPNLVADVSQNVQRAPFCVDGSAPTITPGGVIVVKQCGRIMVPVEKLLAHSFPLHKMSVPKDMTDKEAEDLGGNTMHLASVGLALLIGLAGVDWSLSAAQAGRKPAGIAPPTESAIYIDPAGSGIDADSGRKRRMPLPGGRHKASRRR